MICLFKFHYYFGNYLNKILLVSIYKKNLNKKKHQWIKKKLIAVIDDLLVSITFCFFAPLIIASNIISLSLKIFLLQIEYAWQI